MECGKYKVIEEIHVFQCELGQLKLPKGAILKIRDQGFMGIVGNIKFPGRLLDGENRRLLRIY